MKDHTYFQDRLNDYLDEALPEAERLEVARHIDQCPQCSAELERLESLIDQARELPESIGPRRDLWPEIEAQIAPHSVRPARKPFKLFGFLRPQWAIVGAAAATAIVVMIISGPPEERAVTETAETQESKVAVPAHVTSLMQALEYECMGAGKQLLASMNEAGSPSQMKAAATIEQSVRPLDIAIEEMKSALEISPGNPELLQMLTDRYQHKLSLLHRAIRLVGEA